MKINDYSSFEEIKETLFNIGFEEDFVSNGTLFEKLIEDGNNKVLILTSYLCVNNAPTPLDSLEQLTFNEEGEKVGHTYISLYHYLEVR